jgi:nitrate/nitrite transport system permease protein
MSLHEPLDAEVVELTKRAPIPDVVPDRTIHHQLPAPDAPRGTPPPPARRSDGRLRRAAAAIGWASVGFAVVIAIWQFGSWRVEDLPGPSETLTKLRSMLSDPFYDKGPNDKGVGLRLWTSLQLVLKGFALATIVGMPAGLAIGASRRAWQAANPVIQMLRPVSPLAWFPIWLVVFRDSGNAATWVIFITALWPVLINTAAGAAAVPADQRDVARVFQFGRLSYLRHVLVPNALPQAVTGMRLSMGTAWMVIVAVEMLSTSSGIGTYVWVQYNALNFAAMISAIVLIGIVGVFLDLVFLRLARAVAIEEAVK